MRATCKKSTFISGLVVLALCLASTAFGATIHVTNDFPTIQAAIDAAGSNDTIQIQAGTYREFLNITAPVRIIGSGSTNCIIHHTNDVLVTITSAGNVELAGLEICGGEVAFGGGFSPTVPQGIVASNTTLALNDVTVNMTRNFAITVTDGSLFATNVALYTRIVLQQWDVGFQLKGCFARIYQLTQQAGQIDHTVNINDPPANYSDVRVENSTIQASHLGYGECIRTYTQSSVVISNCDLYRAAGGDPINIGNQAIGVNGYSNNVIITDNLIDSLPTGIRVFGSLPNSNAIRIEHNEIINSESNGVLAVSMSYTGIDLGGGPFQSAGQNYFYNPGARDVELSATSAGIAAISNCWSTANPDDCIIDHLDNGALGRVSYNPTYCLITNVTCSLTPALVTNVVGLSDGVGVTVTANGAPAAGVTVTFGVSGAHSLGPSTLFTDTNGQAGITYQGTNFGTDTITVSGNIGLNAFNCQATKQWVGLPPALTCPGDIIINTAAGTCAQTVTYNASAGGIPTPVVTYDLPSGTSFLKGVTPVTVTASNAFGATNCSFTVTVNDGEPPSITCGGDITTNIPPGQSHVNVTFGSPTASDNCGTVTTSCSPSSGSAFTLGTNLVTCTAIDSSANTNTCSFHVIVIALPSVTCSLAPPLVTNVVGLSDGVGVTITSNGVPAANVTVIFNVSGAHNLGPATLFTDANGQAGITYLGTNFGTDTITVSGNIGLTAFSCQATKQWVGLPPALTCPGDIITNTAAGTCAQTVTYNASAGGIPTPVVTYDLPSGTSFLKGVTPVTVTASNAFGVTNCSFTVTVKDNELPSITCGGDITTNIPSGQSQANVTFGLPTASDNCGIATNYCSPLSRSVFPLGTNAVTATAVDTAGNTNTCSFNVIVQRTPVATHDFIVLSLKPPKIITLSNNRTNQTKSTRVVIQNLGSHNEIITNLNTLTNLVVFTIESLGACPVPTVSLVPIKKGFPIVLAPKKKLTLLYNITFGCANDPLATTKSASHSDFRYTVTINSSALDGNADLQPSNNTCPRPPDLAIGDKGCGNLDPVTRKPGAEVLTDVILK